MSFFVFVPFVSPFAFAPLSLPFKGGRGDSTFTVSRIFKQLYLQFPTPESLHQGLQTAIIKYMPLPSFNEQGDLPLGVPKISLPF